jgi:hypothetical protein
MKDPVPLDATLSRKGNGTPPACASPDGHGQTPDTARVLLARNIALLIRRRLRRRLEPPTECRE